MTSAPDWYKSSHSMSNGHCVEVQAEPWHRSSYCRLDSPCCAEVASLPGAMIGVRDSKQAPQPGCEGPTGPELEFTPGAWHSFIATIKRGEIQ